MKKNFWRGVEGVEFLWHGEWADPELRYGNIVANCHTVEDELHYDASEELPEDDAYGDEFSKWCQEHREDVIKAIYENQTAESKRYNFYDALDGGEIVYEDPIVINGLFINEVRLDEECRMWIRTVDDWWHELEQVNVYDSRRREFLRYYGGAQTEIELINAHAAQCYGEWLSN